MKYSYLYIISFIAVLFVGCAAPPPIEITDTSKEIELDCFTVILPPENNWTAKNLVGGFPPSAGYCYDHFAFTSNQEELYFRIGFFNNTSPHGWRDEFTKEYFLNKIEKQETDTDAEIEIVSGVKDYCIKRKIKTISSVPPPIEGLKLKTSDKYYTTFLTYYVTEGPINGWGITYIIGFIYISTDERPEEELETKALDFLKNVKYQKDWPYRLDKT